MPTAAASPPSHGEEESTAERLDRELGELMQEIRVLLPGVQIVFAFLLTVPFNQRFDQTTTLERSAYYVALVAVAIASLLLIAPSAMHQLRWRSRDKEWIVERSHLLVIGGIVALAVAVPASVLLVTSFLFGFGVGVATTAAVAVGAVGLWFVIPMLRSTQHHS